ncbi:MAG TPA: DUF881 domain-containing protein [Armatimonadota bacterium]|jgi:uncharacterized protein YlxW (UPF0749 family)
MNIIKTPAHAPDKVNVTQRYWLWQVTALALLLGLLLGASLRAQRNFRQQNIYTSRYGVPPSAYREQLHTTQALQAEIAKLNSAKSRLEKALAQGNTGHKAVAALSRELQDTKGFSGLTAVSGPGVTVTLEDVSESKRKVFAKVYGNNPENYIIHDMDILQIVNELRTAGAEAIAINNERLTSTSAIRCEGPTVRVNYTQIGVPLHIRAIGDATALFSGLSMAGGVLDPANNPLAAMGMVSMTKESRIDIPAYAGPTTFKVAKPVQ